MAVDRNDSVMFRERSRVDGPDAAGPPPVAAGRVDGVVPVDAPKRRPGRPRGLGKVPGSGRRKNTPNKIQASLREKIVKDGSPLELLISVARGARILVADPEDPSRRTYQYPSMAERQTAARVLAAKVLPDLRSADIKLDGGLGNDLVEMVREIAARRAPKLRPKDEPES